MVGVLTILIVVFTSGGVAKSQQFRVLGEVTRGRHGPGKRLGLLAGFVLVVVGACSAFVSSARGDAQRRAACAAHCKAEGFDEGKLGPSTERLPQRPNQHKFVACICSGGKDPIEIDASTLPMAQ